MRKVNVHKQSAVDVGRPPKLYPKPDYKFFFRGVAGMAACLIAIHWIPDIAIWIHANFFGEKLVINERAFRFKQIVAYVAAGFAVTAGLVGLAWAAWHLPERDAYEAARQAQLDQSIDLEVDERLNERAAREFRKNA